jgi:hypothetical protein
MAKKATAKTKTTRTSMKQQFQEYRNIVLAYISVLRNPVTRPAFFVKGYDVTPAGKKPNVVNIPELIAIVGTAGQLGNMVTLHITGTGDAARLEFRYVGNCPSYPPELLRY